MTFSPRLSSAGGLLPVADNRGLNGNITRSNSPPLTIGVRTRYNLVTSDREFRREGLPVS